MSDPTSKLIRMLYDGTDVYLVLNDVDRFSYANPLRHNPLVGIKDYDVPLYGEWAFDDDGFLLDCAVAWGDAAHDSTGSWGTEASRVDRCVRCGGFGTFCDRHRPGGEDDA